MDERVGDANRIWRLEALVRGVCVCSQSEHWAWQHASVY